MCSYDIANFYFKMSKSFWKFTTERVNKFIQITIGLIYLTKDIELPGLLIVHKIY